MLRHPVRNRSGLYTLCSGGRPHMQPSGALAESSACAASPRGHRYCGSFRGGLLPQQRASGFGEDGRRVRRCAFRRQARRVLSRRPDRGRAGAARAAGRAGCGARAVLLFARSMRRPSFAAELARLFEGVLVVGCTSAGEIGPGGYHENSVTGGELRTARVRGGGGSARGGGRARAGPLRRDRGPAAPRARPSAGGLARRRSTVRAAAHRQHEPTRGGGGLARGQRAGRSPRARRLGR